MTNKRRIVIKKTPGEWDLIDEKTLKNKRQSTTSYVVLSVSKIVDQYKENPIQITSASGLLKRREFYICNDTFTILEEISRKMQRPVCQIIDDLLFAPLLLPD